ncbi:MAG: hypothetical protein EWV85_00350, partial [Microcystis aeruginosa Ma_QC_C_20070703_M131]
MINSLLPEIKEGMRLWTPQGLGVDILAAVKRTAIPKPHDLGFCFFPEGFFAPALTDLLCSGL